MTPVFDFSIFPILTTERLRLRQLTHDDAEGIMGMFSSTEVLRFLNDPPIETHTQAINFIDWLNSLFRQHDAVQWGITLRGEDHVIGVCGNYEWERSDRHIDIGYHIAFDYWGQGYATEATHAIIRWSFENLNLHRIQADCTDGNIASERVLLKCGFKVEGLWRESCWEHGRFVDIKQFGLLRREYLGE